MYRGKDSNLHTLRAPDPKSGVSTNSTTAAYIIHFLHLKTRKEKILDFKKIFILIPIEKLNGRKKTKKQLLVK